MRKKFYCLLALTAVAAFGQKDQPSGPPPPDDPMQKKIINDAIAKARLYTKELPDFVCNQVSRRSEDLKGTNQWKTLETVNQELTVIHGKEEYRMVAVNGKKVNADSSRPGWTLEADDFSRFLAWTVDPKSETEMSWSAWDALRGHRVHTLGFRVTKEHSQWTFQKGKGEPITLGYFGVINVDSETGAILKLGLIATDIPANYPANAVTMELNWEYAKVGDHYYLLPFKAEYHAKEGKTGKTLTWNEVEYRDFHKPGSGAATAKAH